MKHIFLAASIFLAGALSFAEDTAEHGKHETGEEAGHEAHQEKADEHGHEEGHEEEGSESVGPDKGILAADEHEGIQLASVALKNFAIRTQTLSGSGPWPLPVSARLLSLEESNLYRLRGGWFKRVDFELLSSNDQKITVSSSELKEGDEIVVEGVGFLRITELTAFGGAPEGHSH